MKVIRKSLMGIDVNYDLPFEAALEQATTVPVKRERWITPPTPLRRHGVIRRDMTLIGFDEEVPLEEVVADGTADGSLRAHPLECLAMVRACPHLASDLGVKSFAAVAPWICRPPPTPFEGFEVEEEAGGDRERYCLGVRYVGVGIPARIPFPYWFEGWPPGYLFLFVDPLRKERPTSRKSAVLSPAA